MRHYSVAQNPLELGFFGAEAAAEQGYGWQYTYLFFRNQDEAERFGIGDDVHGLAGRLDRRTRRARMATGTWRANGGSRRADRAGGCEGYEELGAELGIRTAPGSDRQRPGRHPHLAGRPELAQIEAAIEAVR